MVRRRVGQARAQRHVRTAAVVVVDPASQNRSQMRFGQGNQPIQALAADRADQALTNWGRVKKFC